MTTSGTTTFNLDLNDAVEEAFERCGAELRTGYDLRTARRSLNLLLADWASRGINMWTFNQGMIPLVQGTNTYTLPSDTVDLLEHVIRTGAGNVSTQVDLTITRISVSTYSSIPNKLQQARPIQVLVNRNSNATYPAASSYSPGATAAPSITVWPTPDQTGVYQFVYWYLRRIQDAGAGGEATQDIPFRFKTHVLEEPSGIQRLDRGSCLLIIHDLARLDGQVIEYRSRLGSLNPFHPDILDRKGLHCLRICCEQPCDH